MKRFNLLAVDVVAAIVLAAIAVAVDWESYLRGVDPGTLGAGLVSLGMFLVLAAPWRLQPTRRPSNVPLLILACLALILGLASDLLLPMALGWSALLWAWLSCRLAAEDRDRVWRLMLLTLFVFPWADVDIKAAQWVMRITAASVTQHILTGVGLPTTREGTMLWVAGQPVEISEDCAGGDTLHAMLVVGVAAAFVYLDRRRPILPWLPVLGVLAWLANTLRVLMIAATAGWFPDSDLLIWVHDAGGWLVIAFMLGLCIAGFAMWNRFHLSDLHSRVCAAQNRWSDSWQEHRTGAIARVGMWSLLGACVVLGTLWRMIPLPDAQERLLRLPTGDSGVRCRDVPFSESELRWLGDAQAVKRAYQLGNRQFLVTVIDGTRNRRAVHDPMYCWTIMKRAPHEFPGGAGTALRIVENGIEKEVLFWFSNGASRHASPARFLLQATWRRATLGRFSEEPLLILVEPLDSAAVNWYRVLDEFPWLLEL